METKCKQNERKRRHIVYKVSVGESFNNQSERKMNEYLSKRRTFALDNYHNVTQRKGLESINLIR